jgi:phosphopantothenoylcysteine decarboxylase/phosphopantothenate--cysteine ligase
VRRVSVESAAQMLDAVMSEIAGTDIFIGTAAVADYRPSSPADCKIKKVSDKLDLCMERTVDILATVSQRADRPFTVGFAAETNDIEQHALSKLTRKNLDLIAANEVGDAKVFEADDNALTLFWPNGGKLSLGAGAKTELAVKLVDFIAARFNERAARPKIAVVR